MSAAADDRPRIVEVNAIESRGKPVGIALAANLAIGENVEARAFLIADSQNGRVVLCLFQPFGRDSPQLLRAHSRRHPLAEHLAVDQPVGLGIRSYQRGGQNW